MEKGRKKKQKKQHGTEIDTTQEFRGHERCNGHVQEDRVKNLDWSFKLSYELTLYYHIIGGNIILFRYLM